MVTKNSVKFIIIDKNGGRKSINIFKCISFNGWYFGFEKLLEYWFKGEELIFCKILHYDNSWTESFLEKKRTQVRYKKSGT